MTLIGANDLAAMRGVYGDSLHDTCTIGTHSQTTANGRTRDVWTDGAATTCGYKPEPGSERTEQWGTSMVVLRYDATLRLPLGTTITYEDRVTITHRYGTALGTAITLEVVGRPRQGPLGLVVDLREVSA